jgi:hypothetical protein
MNKIPSWVEISICKEYGKTLISNVSFSKDRLICRTILKNLNQSEGCIKTPIGDLFHHNNDIMEYNCEIFIVNDEYVEVRAKKFIKEGEQLLVNYDNKIQKKYDFYNYSFN